MDDYRTIEIKIAEKHGAVAKGTRKSIGDFLLDNNMRRPVNVKSNNLAKNNYSPNMISAMKLGKWLLRGHEFYLIFVDYKIKDGEPEIINDSGLIPVHNLSWDCLTIEAQGYGVIQMCKPKVINEDQDVKGFLRGMKTAYEKYLAKEAKKAAEIKELINYF